MENDKWLSDLKDELNWKKYSERYKIFKNYVRWDVSDILDKESLWEFKLNFTISEEEIGYIEYDIKNNKIIIKFIFSVNIVANNDDERISWIWEYMLYNFIFNSNFNEFIIDIPFMRVRKFYFKVIKRLLKKDIISKVTFIRDKKRLIFNKSDDKMKKELKNNYAFKKIIIKK